MTSQNKTLKTAVSNEVEYECNERLSALNASLHRAQRAVEVNTMYSDAALPRTSLAKFEPDGDEPVSRRYLPLR